MAGVGVETEAGARASALTFDLRELPDDFYEDPFPYYHRLRRWDPVHRGPDGSYFLTRYDDVVTVYQDHHRFSSDKHVEFRPKFGETPLYEHHTTSVVFRDPPDPDRLDLGRAPNRHLAFIVGGMWLARMEGRVAIGRLVARFGHLRPAERPVRARRARFRALSSFSVAV